MRGLALDPSLANDPWFFVATKSNLNVGAIVGGSVGGAAFLLLLACFVNKCRRSKENPTNNRTSSSLINFTYLTDTVSGVSGGGGGGWGGYREKSGHAAHEAHEAHEAHHDTYESHTSYSPPAPDPYPTIDHSSNQGFRNNPDDNPQSSFERAADRSDFWSGRSGDLRQVSTDSPQLLSFEKAADRSDFWSGRSGELR